MPTADPAISGRATTDLHSVQQLNFEIQKENLRLLSTLIPNGF